MAGYSATPQARKLGLKPGFRVAFDNAPHRWTLTDPPPVKFVDVGIPRGATDATGNEAAIDDDWSGQRLVWRVEHRPKAGPSSGR